MQSTYSAANDDSNKILEENATQQYVADFTKAIIRKHCRHWVLSAWDALLLCEENVHYLQKNDEIKIVDLATGTILDNTVWQNGLHQFLELKHNLPMKVMGFSAVQMTQSLFYSGYANVFGLSGTIGGEGEIAYYSVL